MSEIPFVNQLGDALGAAIAAPRPVRRFRRRRLGVLALAVLLVGATGATVAQILAGPDQVASGTVACYEQPDLGGDVTVLGTITGSPTAACARVWAGGAAPHLVACARGAGVAVIPGRRCRTAGLAPLPAGYDVAQAKVARLQEDVAALEATADCIPPRELARRAQALLTRAGWRGWRAIVRANDPGPCGRILQRGGRAELSLGGALLADVRRLEVKGGPPRSLDRQLFGRHSLNVRLMDASGEECFTVAGLEALARREVGTTGRTLGFKLGHMPANTGLFGSRGRRYAEGCAVAVGAYPVYPKPGDVAIEVEIWRKGG
jgi:hypothetical protein